MSLDVCVYSYLKQHCAFNSNLEFGSVWSKIIQERCGDIDNIEKHPIPLVNGQLALVDWYYQLFTEDNFQNLYYQDSYPTKRFLVFQSEIELSPVTLGIAGNVLIEFVSVKISMVDQAIKELS